MEDEAIIETLPKYARKLFRHVFAQVAPSAQEVSAISRYHDEKSTDFVVFQQINKCTETGKYVIMADRSAFLTDSEQAVVHCIVMRLGIRESLAYLRGAGIQMCERTYYRYKKRVESLKWKRLEHAANLFTEQHLQRLDKLDLIEKLMWENYFLEKSPYRKVTILESIAKIQPYISSYYDATRYVFLGRMKTDILGPEEFTMEEQSEIKESTPLSGYDYNNANAN